MKESEFKLKVVTEINSLIDTYFGEDTLMDVLINPTLKVMIKQNQDKIDAFLNLFTDENGELDCNAIVMEYANKIGDKGVKVDIKDYVTNPTIRSMIPNKCLIINKSDIMKLYDNNNKVIVTPTSAE